MAHGWTPDLHEVIIGVVITVASATFLWLLRRVRTNDIHSLGGKIDDLANDINELKQFNRADHKEFFDRLTELEGDVKVLKAK